MKTETMKKIVGMKLWKEHRFHTTTDKLRIHGKQLTTGAYISIPKNLITEIEVTDTTINIHTDKMWISLSVKFGGAHIVIFN